MKVDRWSGQLISTLTRLLMPCVVFLGSLCSDHPAAQAQWGGNPFAGQTGEDATLGSIEATTFRFNDIYTTPFGPAYADIWLAQSDFLACRPPVGRPFSYALCFFSGPEIGTPVPTDGTAPVNRRCLAPCHKTASQQTAHAMRSRKNNIHLMSPISSASTRS
jgi:hypothetical protein